MSKTAQRVGQIAAGMIGLAIIAVLAGSDTAPAAAPARSTLGDSSVQAPLPAGYDPARLGAQLLAGNSWRSIVAAGTDDHGWANLIATVPFSMGSSPNPTNPNMLGVYPDPTFGQAVRITNLPGARGMTAQHHAHFPPSSTVWARWTLRLEGSDPTVGFTSATITPGESGTYKLAFLFPESRQRRQGWVLMASGQLATEVPRQRGVGTHTPLVRTDAGLPAPAPSGRFVGIYTSTLPTLGGPYVRGDMRTNRDWYSLTMNMTTVSPTEVLHRFFLQRLTVNGTWSPWPVPAWIGWRTTGGVAEGYNSFWLTGNKSGAATLLQWMWLGPWEVTNAPDPYGWGRYGR